MSIQEVADALGVSRQRAYALVARPDFPAPTAELTSGRVWLTADVERWRKAPRPPGRPPADPKA